VSRSFDQYSLALTLCDLIADRTPFDENDTDQLDNRRRGCPDLSFLLACLRPVLKRALSPDPGARFPSCLKFMEALYEAVTSVAYAGESVHAEAVQLVDELETDAWYIRLALITEDDEYKARFLWSFRQPIVEVCKDRGGHLRIDGGHLRIDDPSV